MSNHRLSNEFTAVAVFSAAVLLTVFQLFHRIFGDVLETNIPLSLFLGAGIYYTTFQLSLGLYTKWLWKIWNRRRYIGGHWEYMYDQFGVPGTAPTTEVSPDNNNTINSDQAPSAKVSQEMTALKKSDYFGEAHITHDIDGIIFNAQSADKHNQTASSNVKTLWHSTTCAEDRGRIVTGMEFHNEKGNGIGFFVMHIIPAQSLWPRQPTEMRGQYIFIAGDNNMRGRVVFRKKNKSSATSSISKK